MIHNNQSSVQYRIFSLLLLILWTFFIFYNSMDNADASSLKSSSFLAFLESLIGMAGILTEHLIRKMAHFTEFAIEGVLAALVLWGYTDRSFRYLAWPLLTGLVVALADESLQLFSEGRSSQVTDVWIDFGGVCAGALFMSLLLLLMKKLRVKQER